MLQNIGDPTLQKQHGVASVSLSALLLGRFSDDVKCGGFQEHHFAECSCSYFSKLQRVEPILTVIVLLNAIVKRFRHTAILKAADNAYRSHSQRQRKIWVVVEKIELLLNAIWNGGAEDEN